jgi:hypothetical protein
MYLPEIDTQLPFTDDKLVISSEHALPNVTKGIDEVLRLCNVAGLDPHGLGCGMSVVFFPSGTDNRLLLF